MEIEWRDIDSIEPYKNNPRIHGDAVEKVASSIEEFGWRQPIVIDAEGIIVVGHARYKAAQQLNLQEAPVHVADDLTPEQARAYRLADNATRDLSFWDGTLLEDELGMIDDIDMELLGVEFPEFNPEDEWEGMPEFEQEDSNAYTKITVYFPAEEDYEQFQEALRLELTKDSGSIWYPEKRDNTGLDVEEVYDTED